MTASALLSPAQTQALAAELDAIRDELIADLGERDVRYIRRMIHTARGFAILGRGLLMFGFNPLTWVPGVLSLGLAKILENMEIGHNVMHGQYDWTGDPRLDSQRYEWDNVCTADDWRHFHNVLHHNHTNVIGLDRDFGYGLLRLADEVPWYRRHRIQLALTAFTGVVFEWGVGIFDAEPDGVREGRITMAEFRRRLQPFLRKVRRQVAKDYLLFPAIALPFGSAPAVLVGNFTANLVRNVWAQVIIFCGHFPEQVRTWTPAQIEGETRGDWYVRQIEGSSNIEGGRMFRILTGHLSHQIEHHLFPDIPARRYPEIEPRVREICARYGLHYHSGSLLTQYASVLRRLLRHSAPRRREAEAMAA